MKRRISNYGPDVFFRRVRMVFRYLFICLFSSLFIGALSLLLYVTYIMPEGSWSLIPQYLENLVQWKLKGSLEGREFVLSVREFFISHYGNLWGGVEVGFFATILSFFGLSFFFWKVGRKNQESSYLRGAEVVSKKQVESAMKSESRFGFLNGYDLGKKAPKIWEEYVWRGMAIVGRPGTGKSNLIRTMMEQDLDRNVKSFVIDINGDYWKKFGRPGQDKILSLRHKDSELWDIKNEDVVPSLLASYMVERSHSNQPFWWKGGRAVLTSLIEHSKDNEDFKEKIAESDGNILKLLNDNQELVGKVLGKPGSGQAAGVLGNTVLDFRFIKDLGYWPKMKGKTKPFSITEWASSKEDRSWVYVIVRDDEIEELKPLIACWFNLAINGCFRRDEEEAYAGKYPSIRIYLDELKSLGKLEELEKAGERLRKYRASVTCGYQNNAQLNAIYGPEGAKNLKDVLQCKVVYSVGDPEAQEELSKLLGEQEVEEVHSNISYGRKDSDAHTESSRVNRRRIVLPSELGKLPDGHCFMKIGPFDPCRAYIPYKEFKVKNKDLEWGLPPRKIERKGASSKDEASLEKKAGTTIDKTAHNKEKAAEKDLDPRERTKSIGEQIDTEMEF